MDIVINLLLLILAIIWMLSGLFVAFLMWTADKNKGENYKGTYWIKNRGWYFGKIIILVIGGPVYLVIGIFVMWDLVEN